MRWKVIWAGCLTWITLSATALPASAGAVSPGTGCDLRPEILGSVRGALRLRGLSEKELPALKDLECPSALSLSASHSLEVTRVRWDPALHSFELRLRCEPAGECLPFLVRAPMPATLMSQAELEKLRTDPERSIPPLRVVDVRHGAVPRSETSSETSKRMLVRTGQTVTLVWVAGGMRILRKVICLDRGALGDEVRTRGREGGPVVRARVAGVGLVETVL